MPKRIQKHLQFYLSKIKKHSSPRLDLSSKTFSSSKGWILRGCKHPKTPSFSLNDNVNKSSFTTSETDDEDDDSATLADIDRFLSENFKSLYLQPSDDEDDVDGKGKHIGNKENDPKDNGEKPGRFETPRFLSLPPNMTGPYSRFFMNRSSSGSLVEEARTSMTSSSIPSSSSDVSKQNVDNKNETNKNVKTSESGREDFITLTTFSMNPCDDFRRSMLEMVEARLKFNGKLDWEFMEELLFCYLNLNDKKSSKFILNAFVDLIVVLRERLSDSVPVKSRNSVRSRRRKKNNDNGNVTYE